MGQASETAAAGAIRRRLFVYNGGFADRTLRRVLALAGYDVRLGLPGPDDLVGIWGASPTAPRGQAVAARRGVGLLRVEDAFLRSVRPGRAGGGPPLGLMLDLSGVHFDGRAPCDLETLLTRHPLNDPALMARATDGIARLQTGHLSKYTSYDPATPAPAPGYVLVVDQTAGDAAVRASGGAGQVRALLALARAEHPTARIVVKTHPETVAGTRPGHFTAADLTRAEVCDRAVSPWALLAGARAVYTLSSQLGFEAILAGHRPVVLGQPFYAGWGLTDDRAPPARRGRPLRPEQLFAAALILAPLWYDPFRDRLCDFETAGDIHEAATRAWRDDHRGWVATGMRLWKRKPLQGFFGQERGVRFLTRPEAAAAQAQSSGRRLMVWAGKSTAALDGAGAVRVEDGFLRSRGLGADLVPPMSLCLDDLGIYYDPARESRLELLIAASVTLPPDARARALRLVRQLSSAGITKYNLGGGSPVGLPAGPTGRLRILVPGQVEDDASILCGAADIRTNRALLACARAHNPDALILFKPHPDVEAGLRKGALSGSDSNADLILTQTDTVAALDAVDEVWTMTSALGFEALLRGKSVVCLGSPFYAGWGLTRDLGPALPRRAARPDLTGLAHATLIGYPRYLDPVTGRPCPAEVVMDRLVSGHVPRPGPGNRVLSKAQGLLSGLSWLWR